MAKQPEFNPEDLSAEIPAKPEPIENPPNAQADNALTDDLESPAVRGTDEVEEPSNVGELTDGKLAANADRSTLNADAPEVSDSPEALPSDAPETPTMRLDHFLQICGVETGGQAKRMIQGGDVLLNGVIETRRRKKLVPGDEVEIYDEVFVVAEMEETPLDEP